MPASLPGSWSDLVVICGAVPWNGPRMLDQHLAIGLARYGPVLYIDTPVPWRPTLHRDDDTPGRTSERGEPELELTTPGWRSPPRACCPGISVRE